VFIAPPGLAVIFVAPTRNSDFIGLPGRPQCGYFASERWLSYFNFTETKSRRAGSKKRARLSRHGDFASKEEGTLHGMGTYMTATVNQLGSLSKEFRFALEAHLFGDIHHSYRLTSKEGVNEFCRRYLEGLFPLYYEPEPLLEPQLALFVEDLEARLAEQIARAMQFDSTCRGEEAPRNLAQSAEEIVAVIRGKLSELAHRLATDLQAALKNDPARNGLEEIFLTYPGVEVVTVQRLAHELYALKVPYLPRIMTELAHSRTGIDIHPGASIGESFFINHGTGVVIGETATIGKHVTLCQGVTLGAFNATDHRESSGKFVNATTAKRHPDIEDHVIVYPGAAIMGGETRVGHHSIIAGNVWLTHSVPPYSRVTLRDPELVIQTDAKNTDWE
jgi:serine O-acetyltransferase